MDEDDRLVEELVTASRALVGVAVHSVSAAPVEVTVSQFRLLVLVADHGGRSIGDLAEHLGVNQSNASRHVDRLQRLGLVARGRLENDARVVLVLLTEEGRAVVDAVLQQRRDDLRRMVAALSPRQGRSLVDALQAFNRAAQQLDEAPWTRDPW